MTLRNSLSGHCDTKLRPLSHQFFTMKSRSRTPEPKPAKSAWIVESMIRDKARSFYGLFYIIVSASDREEAESAAEDGYNSLLWRSVKKTKARVSELPPRSSTIEIPEDAVTNRATGSEWFVESSAWLESEMFGAPVYFFLDGDFTKSEAKNEAVKVLSTILGHRGETVFHRFPNVTRVKSAWSPIG